MLGEDVVVVGRRVSDWADEARGRHVEVWVRGREDRVSRSNDGADLLRGHCCSELLILWLLCSYKV